MKRLLLIGDGSSEDGSWRKHHITSTPILRESDWGVVHVLLSRTLRELHGRDDFTWNRPLPMQKGGPTCAGSLVHFLRGAHHFNIPMFGLYSGREDKAHWVDAAILVPDAEDDDPDEIKRSVLGAASKSLAVPEIIVGIKEPCVESWLLCRNRVGLGSRVREELKKEVRLKWGEGLAGARSLDVKQLVNECSDFRKLIAEILELWKLGDRR